MQLACVSAAFIVFTPLALATWRGWPTHWLLALTDMALVLAGEVLTLVTTTSLVLSQPSVNAFYDTYYFVTHGHWVAGRAVAFAIFFLLHWAAYRYARRLWPDLTKTAVWGLAIGWDDGEEVFFPAFGIVRRRGNGRQLVHR